MSTLHTSSTLVSKIVVFKRRRLQSISYVLLELNILNIGLIQWFSFLHCAVPENIHTSPTEGIFSKTSPPLCEFQLSFIHSFNFFGFRGTPPPPIPREIPIPSLGSMAMFWNCTHYTCVAMQNDLISYHSKIFIKQRCS